MLPHAATVIILSKKFILIRMIGHGLIGGIIFSVKNFKRAKNVAILIGGVGVLTKTTNPDLMEKCFEEGNGFMRENLRSSDTTPCDTCGSMGGHTTSCSNQNPYRPQGLAKCYSKS